MLGNQQTKDTIQTLCDRISQTGTVDFPFVLVEWQSGMGVYEYMVQQMLWLVGMYQQDVLILRDLSSELGKTHTLKIQIKKPDTETIISDTYGTVTNYGAREITHRLSLAPAGQIKIVLIENIQRMNIQSANALLKSFEELLPGRLIIGTTTNSDGLLDTIRSRAFLLRTVPVSSDQLLAQYAWQNIQKSVLWSYIALSWWDPETLDRLIAEWETALKWYTQLEQEVFSTGASHRIIQLIKTLSKDWTDTQLIEALMLRASMDWHHSLIGRLRTAQQMIHSNVNSEQVWFWLGIEN